MTKLQGKKEVNQLTLLLTMAYMISYITRTNFGAIISEIERAAQIPKSLLSMAITGSFITYGSGQIISGICGDRFCPKKLVSFGFIITILMNVLIPICQNPYQMLILWCINGFAQSLMWPPIVKIMTALLSEDDYTNSVVKVSWGSSIGTITVYLISPLIISLLSWKYVFLFSALCGTVMLFLWNKYSCEITPERKKSVLGIRESEGKIFTPLMLLIMLVIILQGMLRDGVTTWMPSYISETYNLSNVISILTGVVLPIFSIISYQVASRLYQKNFTNPLLCSGIIFAVGAISAMMLLMFTGKNAALSVLFSALLTGCMHGVNLLLICMLPKYFEKNGNVSTVSGLLNSCTYIGSAISTYGIALASEKLGWNFTLLTWFFIAVLGTAICFVCTKPWSNNKPNVT